MNDWNFDRQQDCKWQVAKKRFRTFILFALLPAFVTAVFTNQTAWGDTLTTKPACTAILRANETQSLEFDFYYDDLKNGVTGSPLLSIYQSDSCNGNHHSDRKAHTLWPLLTSHEGETANRTTKIIAQNLGFSPICCKRLFNLTTRSDSPLSNVSAIDLSQLDTHDTANMSKMFSDLSTLRSIDVSKMDTSNTRDMSMMFMGCSSLTSLDLRSFDTSKVGIACANAEDPYDMWCMFYGCSSLRSIDLSSFNTSNVRNMSGMFYGCSSLRTLDLSSFDTSNVENMDWMFEGCSSLEEIDFSNFDTSHLVDSKCVDLDTPRLKSFKVNERSDLSSMGICDVEGYTGRVINSKGEKFELRNIPKGVEDTYRRELDINAAVNDSRSIVPFDCWNYASLPVKPSPVLYHNGKKLVQGVDYLVSYSNNTKPNSWAELTITGLGLYGGSYKTEFSIGPLQDLETNIQSIRPKTTPLVFSGKRLTTDFVIVVNGRTLRNNTDYTVSYKNNKNVGTATVTITGKGAYTGTKTVTFKIVPKGTSISKLTKGKKAFTVKWKKPSKANLKQTTGYQVRWSTAKSMKGAKSKTVKATSAAGKKCQLKVAKLKASKKYYVQVRTYKKVGGKMYYSSWSKAKAVKTKK